MPKIKTRRAAAKRFAVTGTGEFKRAKAFKSHILEKKSPARKRNLRKATLVAKADHGTRSRLFKKANETVMKALYYARRDRRAKKREFRQLWIARINAAARINGTTYSRFIAGLAKAGVEVNRKMLADLAVNDAAAFAKLVEVAKNA